MNELGQHVPLSYLESSLSLIWFRDMWMEGICFWEIGQVQQTKTNQALWTSWILKCCTPNKIMNMGLLISCCCNQWSRKDNKWGWNLGGVRIDSSFRGKFSLLLCVLRCSAVVWSAFWDITGSHCFYRAWMLSRASFYLSWIAEGPIHQVQSCPFCFFLFMLKKGKA